MSSLQPLIRNPRPQVAALVATSLAVVLAFLFQTPRIDDAYITFRYALNILRGFGCVYHPGETALGLTTPLWAGVLALSASVGFTFEVSALLIAVLSTVGIIVFCNRGFFANPEWSSVRIALPFAMFLCPPIHAAVFSGMEALPYTLAVLLCLCCAIAEHPIRSGLFGACALLLRPDGVIAIGLAFIVLARRLPLRRTLPFTLIVALAFGSWSLYAWYHYGSVVPLSIAAKQIAHPGSPISNLTTILLALFSQRVGEFLLATVGAYGLLYLLRDSKLWIYPTWCFLYLLGLVFAGVQPIFYWYYTPLWIVFLTAGGYGFLKALLSGGQQRAPQILAGLLFLIFAFSVIQLFSLDEAMQRDLVYHQIVSDLGSEVGPEDTLYVCETGILGYGFSHNKMLDAVGINSREVYDFRAKYYDLLVAAGRKYDNPDRSTDWSIDFVHSRQPEWIISPRGYCQVALLEDQEWFKDRYDLIRSYRPDLLGGIVVYRRKFPVETPPVNSAT